MSHKIPPTNRVAVAFSSHQLTAALPVHSLARTWWGLRARLPRNVISSFRTLTPAQLPNAPALGRTSTVDISSLFSSTLLHSYISRFSWINIWSDFLIYYVVRGVNVNLNHSESVKSILVACIVGNIIGFLFSLFKVRIILGSILTLFKNV